MAAGRLSSRWSISPSKLLTAATLAAGCVSAQAALLGRDLDTGMAGYEAYYDTELKITWLADWSYAKTSGYDADGLMRWGTVGDGVGAGTIQGWLASLNAGTGLFGFTGWRLPALADTGAAGCDLSFNGTDCGYNVQTKTGSTVYSELAHLWYATLGNLAYYDTVGIGPQPGWSSSPNSGPFGNMLPGFYAFGTEYAPDTNFVWQFYTRTGQQYYSEKTIPLFAVAVRPGDVAAPEPGTLALLGLGLAGLAATRRRKQ